MKKIFVYVVSAMVLFSSCVNTKPTYTKSIAANGDVVISNIAYRKKLNVPLAILTNLAIGAATSQIKLKDEKTGEQKQIGLRGGAVFAVTSGILTYFIGAGYKASTWEVTDATWQSWWAKVNKKENFHTSFVELNHNGSFINSANFFSPINSDLFRIFTEKDVRTYNSFLKNKIDINTVIAKSYSQMDEGAISAIVKEYPNNNYITQLKERYTTLVTTRKIAEQREYEAAASVTKLFGGLAVNLVKESVEIIKSIDLAAPSNTSSSSNNKENNKKSNKSCEWKLISKSNSSAEFKNEEYGTKKMLWEFKKEGIDGSKPYYKISGTSYLGTEVRYYFNDGGDVITNSDRKLGTVFSIDEAIIMLLKFKFCNISQHVIKD
jgi:hypothetical protein